jgi:DNA repair protein RecN (Recombination protein N)
MPRMLLTLDIRDILLIDRLELQFQPGLNVLTGETGAGKSILLDALGLALGWRGRADVVRQGANQGEVTAVFDLPDGHPARRILEDAGLSQGDELVLRRTSSPDGRKNAYVNDRRCSGEVLRQLSDVLVELHGQQDDRGLLDPRGHRDLLDRFGVHDALLAQVARAWADRARAEKRLTEARARLGEARAEEEFLRHALGELDALDPSPGEEAELDARRRLMQGAERVREGIQRALQAVESAEGAQGRTHDALRWLQEAEATLGDIASEPLRALERALVELGEAENGIAACLDALSFDPLELETTEERLFAIRGLARKHNVLPDRLSELAEALRGRVVEMDEGEAAITALESDLTEAHTRYTLAADRLSEGRRSAATALDRAMQSELAPLKLERAVFETEVTDAPPGPAGHDTVVFQVATNPGAPPGPLNRIASGGELSRFLLALKVCLTRDSDGVTMIFDEIDRGVGGATADAVGRRLAALARGGQVLIVTHSPQVAAAAAHHWRVEKRVDRGMTTSRITALDATARVDEIARMLSGDRITDEARAAARSLLET